MRRAQPEWARWPDEKLLDLRLVQSEEQTKLDFTLLLTVQTMNYLHSGRHRVWL